MLRRFSVFLLLLSFMFMPQIVFAGGVDEHAPIGVMGDHQHKQGEWMASYRYMHMDMPNNYSGTKELSVREVHSDFMISPIEMTMEMHMIGVMYGVTDDVTAMLMVPFIRKEMSHRLKNGVEFTTKTDGIGDVKLSGMFSLKKMIDLPVHFNFGVSFPSGSIDELGTTPAGSNQNLPYPMQLGSGTHALLPGFTYLDKNGQWSWGAQHGATIQLGKNDENYRLGDRHEMAGWLAYLWDDWISTSFRVKGSKWGNINGADPRLNPNMVPTARPDLRGGERVDLFIGVNLLGHDGMLNGHRLALEMGYPVYQYLDGPQLGAGLQGTIGWQKAW